MPGNVGSESGRRDQDAVNPSLAPVAVEVRASDTSATLIWTDGPTTEEFTVYRDILTQLRVTNSKFDNDVSDWTTDFPDNPPVWEDGAMKLTSTATDAYQTQTLPYSGTGNVALLEARLKGDGSLAVRYGSEADSYAVVHSPEWVRAHAYTAPSTSGTLTIIPWFMNDDGLDLLVDDVKVYVSSGTWTEIVTVPVGSTSWTDTSVTPHVAYAYRVVSTTFESTLAVKTPYSSEAGDGLLKVSSGGEWLDVPLGTQDTELGYAILNASKDGVWNPVVLSVRDTTPPAAPTGLSATGDNGTANLMWTNPPDGDLNAIQVYMSDVSDTGPWVFLHEEPASATTTTINGLTNGVTYHFYVSAVDNDGNESPQSETVSVVPVDFIMCAFPGAVDAAVHWHISEEPCPRTAFETPIGSEVTVDYWGTPFTFTVANIYGCIPVDAQNFAYLIPNHGSYGGVAGVAGNYAVVPANFVGLPNGYGLRAYTPSAIAVYVGYPDSDVVPDVVDNEVWTFITSTPDTFQNTVEVTSYYDMAMIVDPDWETTMGWGPTSVTVMFLAEYTQLETDLAGSPIYDYAARIADGVPIQEIRIQQPTGGTGEVFASLSNTFSYSETTPLATSLAASSASGSRASGRLILISATTEGVSEFVQYQAVTTYVGTPTTTASWTDAKAWYEANYAYQFAWDIYPI